MDEATGSLCEGASQVFTGMLRDILLGEDFDLVRLVMWGEQVQRDLRPWFDQIVKSARYSGPVTCHPWSNAVDIKITAATANEVCTMLVRAVYLTILPDRPVFIGTPGSMIDAEERIRAHITANKTAFQRRFEHVCESLESGEWSRVIALADVERLNIGNKKQNTPADPSGRTYTPESIPKGLLCSQLGIEDGEFQERIKECPELIHPSHGKRDRNVRFDVDALINTELYNPSLRAAAILKWKNKSTSKR